MNLEQILTKDELTCINDLLANKDRESYLKLFKIISDNTSEIKSKPLVYYITGNEFYKKGSSVRYNFNSILGVRNIAFLLILSKNTDKGVNRVALYELMKEAVDKSGYSDGTLQEWVRSFYGSQKDYIKTFNRLSDIKLVNPITYNTI